MIIVLHDFLPPSLNDVLGRRPMGVKSRHDAIQREVGWAIKAEVAKRKDLPFSVPVDITYLFMLDSARRDVDNFWTKPVTDSLRHFGVILNDNANWVRSITHSCKVDKTSDRCGSTIISVTPIQ